jgi:hypothetical protein
MVQVLGRRKKPRTALRPLTPGMASVTAPPPAGPAAAKYQDTSLGVTPTATVRIELPRGWFKLRFHELWEYRELLFFTRLRRQGPVQATRSRRALGHFAAAHELDVSSFLRPYPTSLVPARQRRLYGLNPDGARSGRVPVVIIGQVCAGKALTGSYVIKVDVQGPDLKVRRCELRERDDKP